MTHCKGPVRRIVGVLFCIGVAGTASAATAVVSDASAQPLQAAPVVNLETAPSAVSFPVVPDHPVVVTDSDLPPAFAEPMLMPGGPVQGIPRGVPLTTAVLTDVAFMRPMLDFQNRQTNKELLLLENSRVWGQYPTVLLGGQARLSMMGAATNRRNQFSYLGRFPGDFTGRSASDARIVHANAALAVHATPWISVYGELLFSDVFSFPDFKQGSLQTRQAFAVLGNLDESPFYAFIGKKNVSFGDMSTLSPFSQAATWHYFAALHEGIGGGYATDRVNLTVMALNGGRGIRAADSKARGKLNNFAANAFVFGGSGNINWTLGAGFLLGTIYDSAVPEHIDPNAFGPYNSAWDVNGRLQLGRLQLAAEFASTLDPWPATGHEVVAYRVEAAYDSCCIGRASRYSISWSEGIQGPSNSEFEFNQQLVVGCGIDLGPHALLSLEYIRSMGFAPLINIIEVSDRSSAQDTGLVGLTVAF